MTAGSGSSSVDLAGLEAQRQSLLATLDDLGSQADAVKADLALLAPLLIAAEEAARDAEVETALRARGAEGEVAARTIAATMPNPDRRARFEALADEIAG